MPRYDGYRVLGFFPHPDDESYAAGGALAMCAESGADVRLLTATRGEAGIGEGDVARVRAAELDDACAVLGISAADNLELVDGAVRSTPVAPLRDVLSAFVPHLVITLGPDGAYGHLDHLACTEMLTLAVAQMQSAPRILHAVFPAGLFHPVWRGLKRAGLATLVPQPPAGGFGTHVEAVDLCLSLGELSKTKRSAIAAHRSQLPDGDPDRFLRPGLIEPLLREEWYVVAKGSPLPPDASHPLEGL